jgi:hypothetical protein
MKNGLEVNAKGDKFWFLDGKNHRLDGPAAIYTNGHEYYYVEGKLHRDDGPAIYWHDGFSEWWINGKHLNVSSQEEFLRMMKLKAFW